MSLSTFSVICIPELTIQPIQSLINASIFLPKWVFWMCAFNIVLLRNFCFFWFFFFHSWLDIVLLSKACYVLWSRALHKVCFPFFWTFVWKNICSLFSLNSCLSYQPRQSKAEPFKRYFWQYTKMHISLSCLFCCCCCFPVLRSPRIILVKLY